MRSGKLDSRRQSWLTVTENANRNREKACARTYPETFIGCHPERNEGSKSFGKLWKHQRFAVRRQTTRSGFAMWNMVNFAQNDKLWGMGFRTSSNQTGQIVQGRASNEEKSDGRSPSLRLCLSSFPAIKWTVRRQFEGTDQRKTVPTPSACPRRKSSKLMRLPFAG